MFNAIREWFANRNKLPDDLMSELRAEGILMLHERAHAKLTYLNFHAPGKRFSYKTVLFRSTVAVTNNRFLATAYLKLGIDVKFADDQIRKMNFTVEDGRKLLVSFDAVLFQPGWSGTLEYRFNLTDAQQCLEEIQRLIG